MTPSLSIVIPTLDAAATLDATFSALAEMREAGIACECLVVDGGSSDDTVARARAHNAVVLATASGRGAQLKAGGEAARGDWLLFIHADTRLAPGWSRDAKRFIERPENAESAAFFRFAFDDNSAPARWLERIVALRCRLLALPYGDQGLLIGRRFYRRLGGFEPLPLMEDVDLVRRIGRRRLVMLDPPAITSAERYRRDGWLLRPVLNLFCLTLYFLGVPPRFIRRLYA
ncbi:MAG TPA: TIGR04283 family arsenosugar biosynthesis glycosyltransferase [Alphaproteobacteria bacterium]